MGVNPKGRDWESLVNWDDLGKFYAAFAIIWTVFLCTGMTLLFINRRQPYLKIRNIPLAIAATATLHAYLLQIILGYMENGHFPCSAEFWIMSIYLPFGIALFQANMVQLQSVIGQQKKILREQRLYDAAEAPQVPRWKHQYTKRWLPRWRALTSVQKTCVAIGLGMLAQLIVTAAIYATSPMLHGVWGDISFSKGQAKCRKGWEWIPSSFWQLFWAYFYGPYILYKIRHIRDVHHWRMQTLVCVISGLPGTPLWIASVYASAFHNVDKFFIPPMWLAPGIIVMQAVTIFFPIYEMYESRFQIRNTLNIIAFWEEKRHGEDSGSTFTSSTQAPVMGHKVSNRLCINSRRSQEMYTMAALDTALNVNPRPLLHFAATRDFTAENIIFLRQVCDWRAAWGTAPRYLDSITDQAKIYLFRVAVDIYASNIDQGEADFPINIDHKAYRNLEAVFGPALAKSRKRRSEDSERSDIDPFNYAGSDESEPGMQVVAGKDISLDLRAVSALDQQVVFNAHPAVRPLGGDLHPPPEFNEHVFDTAEKSIKYLVLTNTWRKFVDGSQESVAHAHV